MSSFLVPVQKPLTFTTCFICSFTFKQHMYKNKTRRRNVPCLFCSEQYSECLSTRKRKLETKRNGSKTATNGNKTKKNRITCRNTHNSNKT